MSDHITALHLKAVPHAPAPVERRQMRRAGISLQVRIRTADFNDGSFDEVRVTQNASRKAIYFFTMLDRYYKGMRVRVTSPYDPQVGAANLEQTGEVVRVHRREPGYGVAVALLSSASATPTPTLAGQPNLQPFAGQRPPTQSSHLPSERRCGTRSPFIAPVEIIEMRTGTRFQARTSDLSAQGCYVDTLNPLQVGAAVRLQIDRAGQTFDVLANVSSRHSGSGMGLVFADITPAQTAIVESWLGELALPGRTVFANPFPENDKATRTNGEGCALRLIQMLLRKGVLSQSEASELLQPSEG
jgi:hypothetical protein